MKKTQKIIFTLMAIVMLSSAGFVSAEFNGYGRDRPEREERQERGERVDRSWVTTFVSFFRGIWG